MISVKCLSLIDKIVGECLLIDGAILKPSLSFLSKRLMNLFKESYGKTCLKILKDIYYCDVLQDEIEKLCPIPQSWQ